MDWALALARVGLSASIGAAAGRRSALWAAAMAAAVPGAWEGVGRAQAVPALILLAAVALLRSQLGGFWPGALIGAAAALLGGLPDIPELSESLLSHGELLRQIARLQSNAYEAPPLTWAAVCFAGARAGAAGRTVGAMGLGMLCGSVGVCLIFDPLRLSLGTGGILLAPAAAFLPRWRAVALGACLAARAAAGFETRVPALETARLDRQRGALARREAAYVAEKLTRRDLLLQLSEPDRRFTEALDPAVPAAFFAWPDDNSPDGQGLGLAEATGRAAETLCRGGRVWLASDGLFRNPVIPAARMDGYAERVIRGLAKGMRLGRAEVSPDLIHYYPLLAGEGLGCE